MINPIDTNEFGTIVFDILCSAPRDTERYQLEIDGEVFGINQCIEEYEKLSGEEDGFYKLYETLCKKNSDYSKSNDAFSNFKMCTSLGICVDDGIKVRLCDKVSRIRNLKTKEPSVVGESLADTYLDTAGYLLIDYIWIYGDAFCAETVSLKNNQ